MSNSCFRFKQFIIHQDKCAMKVTTDACLFGAFLSHEIENRKLKIENVLDIGTGTGLLALMFAQKNPLAVIDAIDIAQEAVEQAKENVQASPWKERINVINADARSFISFKKYDLIISNPPFYEKELKTEEKKKNIARHSEELTLQQLLNVIKENLNEPGIFHLLLPYKRNSEIRKLMHQHNFSLLRTTFIRQSHNHDYFRIILEGTLKASYPEETQIDEVSVWDEKQQYTPEFIQLLKDYYLYLL